MNAEEIIKRIDKENPGIKTVKLWLGHISLEKYVSELKVGDVVSFQIAKKRPVVIIYIAEDYCIGIPLSSTDDEINLCPSSSRQFGDGYFGKSLVCMKTEYCKHHFIGTFDNDDGLNNAICELKVLVGKINWKNNDKQERDK